MDIEYVVKVSLYIYCQVRVLGISICMLKKNMVKDDNNHVQSPSLQTIGAILLLGMLVPISIIFNKTINFIY